MAFWVNYIIRTALILEVGCFFLPPRPDLSDLRALKS